ncbi:MAG TPA: hypothetical protein DDW50_00235 [Firmicutes bacterium]|jgi:hypothetical protein|nr:hypothetical protein [Bacillota bacterium]
MNEGDPLNIFLDAPENEDWLEIDSIIKKNSRLEGDKTMILYTLKKVIGKIVRIISHMAGMLLINVNLFIARM